MICKLVADDQRIISVSLNHLFNNIQRFLNRPDPEEMNNNMLKEKLENETSNLNNFLVL